VERPEPGCAIFLLDLLFPSPQFIVLGIVAIEVWPPYLNANEFATFIANILEPIRQD
jgi:hypothetical protein